MNKPDDMLWDIKYRPSTVDDCILPKENKAYFKAMIENDKLPNLLLCSSEPGTGKTTVARALCSEMNKEMLFINASEMGGIDILRTLMRDFVSCYSIEGMDKVVILDEFDQTTDSFQKAFRGFIEEFPSARFILTANYINRVIKPIRSRMNVVEFTQPESERKELIKQGAIRCINILKSENIPVSNNKIIIELVNRNYPDNRSTIVELQRYAINGEIDEGILGKVVATDDISQLIQAIKNKSFSDARQLIPFYATDYVNFITNLYRKGETHVENGSIGDFILILGENQKYASVVANMELHISALIVELMAEVNWK